jgi:hypothetical protein
MVRRPEAAVRLSRDFDVERLRRDLQVAERYGGYTVPGRYDGLPGYYHDGEWTGVGLVAIDGRYDDTSSGAVPSAPFRETEVLAHTRYFKRLLDSLPFQKRSVRLSYLPPGGVIRPHVDASTRRGGMVRLHLPIVTDPEVRFFVGGRRWRWREGELWFADVARVHSVENRSPVTRVHLLIDGVVNEAMLELFPAPYVRQANRCTNRSTNGSDSTHRKERGAVRHPPCAARGTKPRRLELNATSFSA